VFKTNEVDEWRKYLPENLTGGHRLEHVGVHEILLLDRAWRNMVWGCGFIWLRI